jgi:molybdopterin converting factor small subunit
MRNKEQQREYNKLYYQRKKELIAAKQKEYREANKEKLANVKKLYYQENKEQIIKKQSELYHSDIEVSRNKAKEKNRKYKKNKSEYDKKYREINKEQINEKRRAFYKLNKDKVNESKKKYREANRDKINEWYREYRKKRCETDPLFKLKRNISVRIRRSLQQKNFTKKSKTFQIIGCTPQQLKEHLEKQFQPWMNWDNYGLYNGTECYGWDIDHIIPLDTAITEEDVIRLNHYTNLQPLCSHINRDVKKHHVWIVLS